MSVESVCNLYTWMSVSPGRLNDIHTFVCSAQLDTSAANSSQFSSQMTAGVTAFKYRIARSTADTIKIIYNPHIIVPILVYWDIVRSDLMIDIIGCKKPYILAVIICVRIDQTKCQFVQWQSGKFLHRILSDVISWIYLPRTNWIQKEILLNIVSAIYLGHMQHTSAYTQCSRIPFVYHSNQTICKRRIEYDFRSITQLYTYIYIYIYHQQPLITCVHLLISFSRDKRCVIVNSESDNICENTCFVCVDFLSTNFVCGGLGN